MSAEALLRFSPVRQNAWSSALGSALGPAFTQVRAIRSARLTAQLAAQQFASLGSWVFAHQRLLDRVGSIEVHRHGLGVGALGAGNKGATGLRCIVGGSVLVFVNVHLAAFADATVRRNADMADIFRRLAFPLPPNDLRRPLRRPHSLRPEILSAGPDVANAFESDALFVSGDLNYRIEPSDGDDALVKSGAWSELLERDQVRR